MICVYVQHTIGILVYERPYVHLQHSLYSVGVREQSRIKYTWCGLVLSLISFKLLFYELCAQRPEILKIYQ